MNRLSHLGEPRLGFRFGQTAEDPRDGLFLFGPPEESRAPKHLRVGVVGTAAGIARYKRWVQKASSYLPVDPVAARNGKAFPGFRAAFDCSWPVEPACVKEVREADIRAVLPLSDRYQAIYKTVSIFSDAIERHLREDEPKVDFWFVVIPDDVHRLGRPTSMPQHGERIESPGLVSARVGRRLLSAPSLFKDWNAAAEVYRYEKDFHNQLKARLLQHMAVVQVVRESTLTPEDFTYEGRPLRAVQDPASIAWNLSTTAYFKAGGRPWKLADVRPGVCYIGIVFKQDHTDTRSGNACCGAQMFLDSGDGLVFKGALGPWFSPDTKQYHLSSAEAERLVSTVLRTYEREHGTPPTEVFVHGRTRFSDEEWAGFRAAASAETEVVCVRIRESADLKLYPPGKQPVLRGMWYHMNQRHGYLFTKGFIPALGTYPGREVPNPLDVEICQGSGDLGVVMGDILGLTKVNYNTCIYADGKPVTLRFADAVGEILTSAPIPQDLPPLPFRHYV